MKTVGVIVGRFQTPILHKGHNYLVQSVRSRHDAVLVVLGTTTTKLSKDNPLDAPTREVMLRGQFPDLAIRYIYDVPSDTQWSDDLDRIINEAFPEHTPVLYGARDSFISAYSGKYECCKLPTFLTTSATELRDQVLIPSDHDEFRRGVIYAAKQQFPTSYQAVDVAVLKGDRVLLGTKRTDCGRLRFIGGFVDPKDVSLEQAARRELSEETGMMEADNFCYLGSARIDDIRYRNDVHKVMSAFFLAQYVWGAPKASDDLDGVEWVHVDAIMDRLVPHHRVLGDMLLADLGRKETM